MLILATTAAAVAWMAPGRKLEKVGSGVITGVEKKRFTLDGKTIYGDEIELTETALSAKGSHLFWQGQ